MFCSVHDFISKTLSLNLFHCYLKCRRLVTFSLTLILKVRVLDILKSFEKGEMVLPITKLLSNVERLEK